MKSIYIMIVSMVMVVMSCQKDDNTNNTVTGSYGDEIPVEFSFSFDAGVSGGTEYQPMTKAETDEVKIKFSKYGGYRIYILKEIDGNWIVEQMNELTYPGSAYELYFSVKEGTTLPSFKTQLRPGKYRLVIFTGNRAAKWNEDFEKPGFIVADNTNQGRHTYACTYKIGGITELVGKMNINEEIFSAMHEFTVEKNEELTTPPKANSYNLTLLRKVGKIRILLKHEAFNGNNDELGARFVTENNNVQVINGVLNAVGEKPFCNGLDIWGEPWYDTDEPLRNLIYATYTTAVPDSSAAKVPYFVPKSGDRFHVVNYFTVPGDTVDIKFTGINVTANTNYPPFYLMETPSVKLIHNTITGFVIKPSDYFEMDMAEGEDVIDLFGCYKEYN